MKDVMKLCGTAIAKALLNGLLALSLMLIVEFSISGNLDAYRLYLCAAVVVTLAFLIYQLIIVRRHAAEARKTSQH